MESINRTSRSYYVKNVLCKKLKLKGKIEIERELHGAK